MNSSELRPMPMQRVAVVAPRSRTREALVEIAEAGVMEVDDLAGQADTGQEAVRLAREAPDGVESRLSRAPVDLVRLRERHAWDLVVGEAELARHRADAVEHGPANVLLGWVPAADVDGLASRLAERGSSVVRLPRPRTAVPPTRMAARGLHGSLRPLVSTYAVVPYEDVDPSLFAGVTYVLMFGMMFGDVGHGLLLALLGVWLARSRRPRLAGIRRLWLFPVAAGLTAVVFGLLYGEAFGPTGLVPTLWLSPLDEPVRLLLVAVGAGAVLIAASYVIGTVNRWREGGPSRALYSPNGLAGVLLFLGAALAAAGIVWGPAFLGIVGGTAAGLGMVLTFLGLRAEAGSGGAATAQAVVELFDTVVRVFANVVSFGRLAAFGMTHAAIGFAVWEGTSALWAGGGFAKSGAAVLFLVGNAVAFALEGLVVAVQAMRLEYYELFSRIFTGEGRLFEPWHVPIESEEPS